jgi:hypothetical protein
MEGIYCAGPEHAKLYAHVRNSPPAAVIDAIIEYLREKVSSKFLLRGYTTIQLNHTLKFS